MPLLKNISKEEYPFPSQEQGIESGLRALFTRHPRAGLYRLNESQAATSTAQALKLWFYDYYVKRLLSGIGGILAVADPDGEVPPAGRPGRAADNARSAVQGQSKGVMLGFGGAKPKKPDPRPFGRGSGNRGGFSD